MRGRDDRAAANQRATNPLYVARIRAVQECEGRLVPQKPGHDSFVLCGDVHDDDYWDCLSVEYLRSEWPPARLN